MKLGIFYTKHAKDAKRGRGQPRKRLGVTAVLTTKSAENAENGSRTRDRRHRPTGEHSEPNSKAPKGRKSIAREPAQRAALVLF